MATIPVFVPNTAPPSMRKSSDEGLPINVCAPACCHYPLIYGVEISMWTKIRFPLDELAFKFRDFFGHASSFPQGNVIAHEENHLEPISQPVRFFSQSRLAKISSRGGAFAAACNAACCQTAQSRNVVEASVPPVKSFLLI